MMTGGALFFLRSGIWNCTYIWPIMIWSGLPAVGLGLPGGGVVAYLVTLGTPPMKKLPWSSITNGLVRNFFALWFSCAGTLAVIATSRTAKNRQQPILIMRFSCLMEPPHHCMDADGSFSYCWHPGLRRWSSWRGRSRAS